MPQYHPIMSLQEICFENIVKNMDNVWCDHFLREMNQTHWLFVQGPFDTIQPKMCTTLISTLHKRRILRRHHIYLLINPGLPILHLTGSPEVNTNLILQLVATRCRRINSIDLSLSKFKGDYLHDVFRMTEKCLTEIRLAKTPVTDSDLAVIGRSCPKLRYLDLMDNVQVSDRGFQTLFKATNIAGGSDLQCGKCLNLVSLDIRGTSISTQLAAEFLKHSSGRLINFEYHNSFDAVLKYLSVMEGDILSIRQLEFHSSNYESDPDSADLRSSFEFVAQFCPAVNSITFELGDLIEEEVLEPFLRNNFSIQNIFLQVERRRRFSGTFFRSAMNFQAQTLTSLSLVEVGNVSLPSILDSCFNLENLQLDFVEYLRGDNLAAASFGRSKLKSVKMQCTTANSANTHCPSSSEFGYLLGKAQCLESLDVSVCDELDDAAFQLDWGKCSFPKLKSLRLVDCNEISFHGLSIVTHCKNSLEDLVLLHCQKIYLGHVEAYKKYLKQNGFNVNVTWK